MPYLPVSKPLKPHFSVKKNVSKCRVKYMIATPVQSLDVNDANAIPNHELTERGVDEDVQEI